MDYEVNQDEHKVKRYSSIYQHKGMLCAVEKGEYVPILFDMIDGIDCDKVYSHKIVLELEPWIGYEFPVDNCEYRNITYLMGQSDVDEINILPEFFGEGLYASKGVKDIIPSGEGGALGVDNTKTLRVGLDYVLADDYLEPVD